MSMMQRMGSIIAAARMGVVCNEISGTAMMPNAPEKPPLEMPVMKTATAIRKIRNQSIEAFVYCDCG